MDDQKTADRYLIHFLQQLLGACVLGGIGYAMYWKSSAYQEDAKNLLVNIAYGVFGTALVLLLTACWSAYLLFQTKVLPRFTGDYSLVGHGLRRVGVDRMNVVDYARDLANCRNGDTVKMMGISLQSLISTPGIEKTLMRLVQAGVTFRFLIMASDSQYIAFRYKEYEFRREFEAEIIQFTTFLEKVRASLPLSLREHIQVRYYDLPPRYFLMTTAKMLFFQFYIYGRGEFGGPCFAMVRNEAEIGNVVEQSFDHVWHENSSPTRMVHAAEAHR